MEILYLTVECKDGSINTYSGNMPSNGVATAINEVKVLKDWVGGKLIDAHTWEDNKKFTYDVKGLQHLLSEEK